LQNFVVEYFWFNFMIIKLKIIKLLLFLLFCVQICLFMLRFFLKIKFYACFVFHFKNLSNAQKLLFRVFASVGRHKIMLFSSKSVDENVRQQFRQP